MSQLHRYVFTCKHSVHIKHENKTKPNPGTGNEAGTKALHFENRKLTSLYVHANCVRFQMRLIFSTVLV